MGIYFGNESNNQIIKYAIYPTAFIESVYNSDNKFLSDNIDIPLITRFFNIETLLKMTISKNSKTITHLTFSNSF
jgi:hypothetical protein